MVIYLYLIQRELVLKSLEQELESMYEINHSLVIVAATIYNHEHNYESALRVLRNNDTLEGFVFFIDRNCVLVYMYVFIIELHCH